MQVSRLRSGLVVLGVLVCMSGCRRQAAQVPSQTAQVKAAPASPAPAAPADPPPTATTPTNKNEKPADKTAATKEYDASPPESWSDPRVLAELAKNCAFDPDSLPAPERSKWIVDNDEGQADSVMSCQSSMEQSCTYDPCYDEQGDKCNPRCISQCKDCGKGCASKCEMCKSTCQDDACRMACAKKCAGCHEICVRKRDRCATGTCTEEYKKCREKLRTEWRANGCTALCATISDCKKACEEKNEKAKNKKDCDKSCAPKGAARCNLLLCQDEDGMGIDPESVN